jgi:DNA polymerase-4
MPERVIAHFDMDAFYVSVELLRRPELRGRPVVVAGSGPRAVVTTASYEARRYGVFSATPAARARRLCPDAVFIPPDFDQYRARSAEVMAELGRHFDRLEVVGLDEAYADLTAIQRPRAAVVHAREAIRRRTGLACSIGIGPSKLVAKMASDAEKPNGLVVLSQGQARARFGPAAPELVPGIGPRTAERLRAEGIATLADLAATDPDRLADWFGPRSGPHLRALARFEDARALSTHRVRKSESRETTFNEDIRSRERLRAELDCLGRRLCADLSRKDRRGRTIAIKVRLDDFSTHTRARTLEQPTCDERTVLRIARELLDQFDPRRPVRLLGVRIAAFEPPAREAVARPQLELTL